MRKIPSCHLLSSSRYEQYLRLNNEELTSMKDVSPLLIIQLPMLNTSPRLAAAFPHLQPACTFYLIPSRPDSAPLCRCAGDATQGNKTWSEFAGETSALELKVHIPASWTLGLEKPVRMSGMRKRSLHQRGNFTVLDCDVISPIGNDKNLTVW